MKYRALISAVAVILGSLVAPAAAYADVALPGTNGKVLSISTYMAGSTPMALVCGNFTAPASGAFTVNLSTGTVAARASIKGGWVDSCIVYNGIAYAGGSFTSIGGQSRNKLGAMTLSSLKPTKWKPYVAGQRTYSVTTDGSKVYAATSNAVRAFSVTSAGQVWAQPIAGGAARAVLAVPQHNRLYVGGAFGSVGGVQQPMLAALALGDGGVDPTWKPSLRSNTGTGSTPGYDGENVLALAWDHDLNRICTGIAGWGTNAMGCFSAYSGSRDFMQSTIGDVQAILIHDTYYFAGYHRTYRAPVPDDAEWIANAWGPNGSATDWGNGFSGPQDPEQGGPFGNDHRNGGINALAVNPMTGARIAGGAFTTPGRSLAVIN